MAGPALAVCTVRGGKSLPACSGRLYQPFEPDHPAGIESTAPLGEQDDDLAPRVLRRQADPTIPDVRDSGQHQRRAIVQVVGAFPSTRYDQRWTVTYNIDALRHPRHGDNQFGSVPLPLYSDGCDLAAVDVPFLVVLGLQLPTNEPRQILFS